MPKTTTHNLSHSSSLLRTLENEVLQLGNQVPLFMAVFGTALRGITGRVTLLLQESQLNNTAAELANQHKSLFNLPDLRNPIGDKMPYRNRFTSSRSIVGNSVK